MRIIITVILLLLFFNTSAQVIEHFKYNGKDTSIILLPFDFPLPDSLTYIGKLKSGDPYLAESPTYKPTYKNQLHVLCTDALHEGANVIQITHFTNVKWKEQYNLKGKAYKTKDLSGFRKTLLNKKDADMNQMRSYSNVIIYRPNYTQSLNDLSNYKLIINNDTLTVTKNSKFNIRIEKEGKLEVKVAGKSISQTLDIKFGTNYYLCTHADYPGAYSPASVNHVSIPLGGYVLRIEVAETDKGEIESSMISSERP